MAIPRIWHTATLLPNGKVLAVGGFAGAIPVGDLYDPISHAWGETGLQSSQHIGHTATLLLDGTVLLLGGYEERNFSSGSATSEVYHPETNQWTAVGALNEFRAWASAVRLPNGKVLVAGGLDPSYHTLSSAEIYDPTTGLSDYTGSMNFPRSSFNVVLLRDGKVLAAGGYTGGDENSNKAELYDPDTGKWTVTGTMKHDRASGSMTMLRDGRVLVAGGETNGKDGATPNTTLRHAEIYNPAKGTWKKVAPMKSQRINHTATLMPSGKVLVAGGNNFPPVSEANPYGMAQFLATTEEYDPASDTWSSGAAMLTFHSSHTATLLPDGQLLIAGGTGIEPQVELLTGKLFHNTFTGLVTATPDGTRSVSTEGLFTATVQTNRAFTAKLYLNGLILPISGVFDDGGIAVYNTPFSNGSTYLVSLRMDQSFGVRHNKITGVVVRKQRNIVEEYAYLSADQSFFDGKTDVSTVPGTYLGLNNAPSEYHLIFPAKHLSAQPTGITRISYPMGTGYSRATLTKSGAITFAGVLADGTPVTGSTTLASHLDAPELIFPLFAQLYKGGGFISATVVLDHTQSESDMSVGDGSLHWARPAMDVQYYPYGWPEVINTGLLGARYTVTQRKSVFLPLEASILQSSTAARTLLKAELQVFNLVNKLTDCGVTLNAGDKATLDAPGYTLMVNRKHGLIRGNFPEVGTGVAMPYQGIVYQKGSQYGAHGFALSPAPGVKDYTGQSLGISILPLR